MTDAVGNAAVEHLIRDLQRLHDGLARWSPTRWAGLSADGRTRGDVLFALVGNLAMLAERAGCGAPAELAPRRLDAHALPDQLIVVGGELVAAPRVLAVAAAAEQALSSAHQLLLS